MAISFGIAAAPLAGLAQQDPYSYARSVYGTGQGGTLAPEIPSAAGPAGQAGWRVTPYVSVLETLTNNVRLQPSGQAETDLVTQVTPGLRVQGNGRRAQLNGTVAATGLLYVNTTENNRITPQIDLLGRVEAIERFFFVEAAANVQQTYLTPFGAQPVGQANVTNNRYTYESYRVSPYIQGRLGRDISYYLRDDNIWTTFSNTPVGLGNSYANVLTGVLSSPVDPFGWEIDASRSDISYENQPQDFVSEIARLRLIYQFTPQVQVNVVGGYERNDYPGSKYDGAVYGGGVRWRPTERTNVVANWQERFFGSSYDIIADHRTPLSAWGINASRGVTTYPQQLAALPAGGNVELFLNLALQGRIPDPVARQAAVQQIIQSRGLPTSLTEPLTLYNQQVQLQERAGATFGILGARNSLFFNAFYLKTQAITASGDVLPVTATSVLTRNNKQYGLSATFSHELTGQTRLNVTATGTRTDALPPFTLQTTQYILLGTVNRQLSLKTTGFVGLRFQWFDSNQANDYTEAAILAGLNHTF